MQLVRWNPMRDAFGFNTRFDRVFNDFFAPKARSESSEQGWNWNPVVDIYDNEENIIVKAELPGVEKDNIVVDVKGRVLTLKGERATDSEVNEDKYYRRERTYGKFERVFTLPEDVNAEGINAEYKDGVLRIEVPKPKTQQPKQITVH